MSYQHRYSYRSSIGGRHSRKSDKDLISGIRKQSFEEIKAQCVEEGCMWEDPEFPAENESVYFTRESERPFEWKRPHVSKDIQRDVRKSKPGKQDKFGIYWSQIRTHAGPKVGQGQVSRGVSLLYWHDTPIEIVLRKAVHKRFVLWRSGNVSVIT